MATVYNYEDSVLSPLLTNGVGLLSSSTPVPGVGYPQRLLFNNPPLPLTNTAYTTATFYNAVGTGVTSGSGVVLFDNAYNTAPAFLIQTDRTSFATVLLSGTAATSNTVIALTGVTVTSATSGAGYTSTPTVVVDPRGVGGVIRTTVATANMHSTGAGVTSVTVTTPGLYVPGVGLPTVVFTGGGYTTQATGTAVLSSGAIVSSPILSLSANGFNAWGPTERRLRLLEYI